MLPDLWTPPPGEALVLAAYQRPVPVAAFNAIVQVGLLILLRTLVDGADWVTSPLWWLGFGALGVLLGCWERRSRRLSAGLEWFRRGRHHVRTYQLESVRCSGGLGRTVTMRDTDGRSVLVELSVLEMNPDLYRLVQNGINHSIRHGAQADDRARARFAPETERTDV
jgi:hypothetical protein